MSQVVRERQVRLAGGGARWGMALTLTSLVHASVLIPLLTKFHSTPSSASEAPLALDLAPLDAASPTPPTDQPIDTKKQPITPPTAEPTPQTPTPKALQKWDVRPPNPTSIPVAVNQPRASTPPAVAAADTPSPPAKDRTKLSAPVLGASTQAAAHPDQSWESLVPALLDRQKKYPPGAVWQHQEDTVYVRLSIARDGRVQQVKITRSRGYDLLDNEVIDLVHRTGQLPAPPAEEKGDPVILTVPVEFYIRAR